MKPEYTQADKLAAVESVIEEIRQDTESHTEADKKMLGVMAAIAKDLRGSAPERVSQTRLELDRRINIARVNRDASGYRESYLIGVAQELIGRWPTVRQALEKFEQETADV